MSFDELANVVSVGAVEAADRTGVFAVTAANVGRGCAVVVVCAVVSCSDTSTVEPEVQSVCFLVLSSFCVDSPLSAISHGTCPLAADCPLVVGRHGAAETTSTRDVGTDIVVQNTVVEDLVVVLIGQRQYSAIDQGV